MADLTVSGCASSLSGGISSMVFEVASEIPFQVQLHIPHIPHTVPVKEGEKE